MKAIRYFILSCMVVLLSCKEDHAPILDFSDPFGDSSDENVPVPGLWESERPILISEQSQSQVLIIDSLSKGELWSWKAAEALSTAEAAWFREIDEAKAVYNRRSEEHTSELQSRESVVCRLL